MWVYFVGKNIVYFEQQNLPYQVDLSHGNEAVLYDC